MCMFAICSRFYNDNYIDQNNILQFIDDKGNYHTKYIDLGAMVDRNMKNSYYFAVKKALIEPWYCGYLCNKEKFISSECKEAIFDAFRAVTELDVIGELKAIEPILELASESYDIEEISKTITDHISSFCDQLKLLPDIFVDPLYKEEWQEFCDKTNFNSEVVKLADELKSKYVEKQSTSLAAVTGSETIDTTDSYRYNEQVSQQI